jgi:UDP-glucuronate 4-epimerase
MSTLGFWVDGIRPQAFLIELKPEPSERDLKSIFFIRLAFLDTLAEYEQLYGLLKIRTIMRILLTGAAGLIGAPTTKLLIAQGHSVVGIDNFSEYYSPLMKRQRIDALGISRHVLSIDITDSKSLNSVLDDLKPEAVIHLAARPGVRASLSELNDYNFPNVIGFQNVINAVEKYKVKKFVYASSSSIYGRGSVIPFIETDIGDEVSSYYAYTKRLNEFVAQYLPQKGTSTIGLRFFTVYGPWGRPDMALLRFITAGLTNRDIPLTGRLETLRDFTYVEDVAQIISNLVADERFFENEVFNLAASNPHSLASVLEILEQLGVSCNYEQLDVSPFDAKITYGNTSKLRQFGYNPPSCDLETGLAKTLEWVKSRDLNELSSWVYPEN